MGPGAALWVLRGFPLLARLTERLPPRGGQAALRVLSLVLAADLLLSAAALLRMEEREAGQPAAGPVARAMDRWYPDPVLHSRYRNLMEPQ